MGLFILFSSVPMKGQLAGESNRERDKRDKRDNRARHKTSKMQTDP